MVHHLRIALVSVLLFSARGVWAQSLPGSELPTNGTEVEAEDIYDHDEVRSETKSNLKKDSPARSSEDRKQEVDAQSLSDLAKLAPFSDIAVIQRKFLPKTKRFEASASGFTNLNNPFFTSYGLGLELSYYLAEKYALELLGQISSTGSRQVTDDLENGAPKIKTSSLVTSRGFFGAGLKWNPIYGKITWLNRTIVPFDLNFNIAGGMTETTSNQSAPTLHLGTSQVFAYSKSMAFRWDLGWNIYQATVTDNGQTTKLSQNDLFLGVGVSFYFPEATYR